MVFISEAVLPKASGARKTAQGGTSLVTQAQSKCYVGVFQGYFKRKESKFHLGRTIGTGQRKYERENKRAANENNNELPLKESPVNQEPITPGQNCQQESQ